MFLLFIFICVHVHISGVWEDMLLEARRGGVGSPEAGCEPPNVLRIKLGSSERVLSALIC